MENKNKLLVIPFVKDVYKKAGLMRIIFMTLLLLSTIGFNNMILAKELQQQTISGTVLDKEGNPLAGVSITVKGTLVGIYSDADGKYSLSNLSPNATLVFSFVGMKTFETDLNGQTKIDVIMETQDLALEEVVVVGYGTQKKVNLTGSVAAVSSNEIASIPVANTSVTLSGVAPGISVLQGSGRPGTGATVRIRGTGTFSSAGTEPLVLIDGMAGNIDDVDPENVENISILKDASSASIYGNRAANGVVLITTKKGIQGRISITYNNTIGWQKPTILPDFLPSWEYATYYNEAMANMGRAEAYTDAQILKFKDGSDPDNYPNVNHLEWLINSGTGFQQRHNIGLQGGTDALTYNFSVGYSQQDGMTAKTSNKRYNLLWNMKSSLTKSLTLNTHLNGYVNNYKAPNGEPQSIDDMIGFTVREPPIFAGQKSDGSFGYQDNYSPEAWLASESFQKNNGNNIAGTVELIWETPVKGLSIRGQGGYNFTNNYDKAYRANTYFDATKTVGPAFMTVSTGNSSYKTFEGVATYTKELGLHSINIIAGISREMSVSDALSGYRSTFPNNYIYELNAGAASSSTNTGSKTEWALASYFGRANYSFKDRYLLEANLRYDGSSRFAADQRWGIFPSFSAGWRLSEETFWKDSNISDIVNSIKIRASWGVLGNQNIGTYPYQVTYALGQNYPFGNPVVLSTGARQNVLNNPEITWETTAVTNIGLDFELFKGKLIGVLDYFNKNTYNILSSVQVTSILGRTVGQSNVGEVSNKGIEATLTYNGMIGENFNFKISPNFTYIKNAVEKLADGALREINNNRIVGEPLGILYGYQTNGLFVDQKAIDDAPTQILAKANLKPGYIEFVDLSGKDGVPDGKVDANNDRTVIGCTTPKFYYGLTLNASFKGFDFSVLLQGLGGFQRLMSSYIAYAYYNGGQVQRWQIENRWTEENPNQWAEYPRLEILNAGHATIQTCDYWVRDASFLRIKNMQIGYTLPKSILNRLGMENLRIFFSGQNLATFTSFYKGWDPETEIPTGDPRHYPLNSIFSFGLNTRF